MRPTPEQARVLGATGARVPVAAGAGSGKTTLLVERIWRDLTEDGLRLEDLFVATYNRAAAAHITARIQARFADPDGGLPRDRACLDPSAGWIGTFHSLCARIVREHPFTAGVDPLFGELDDAEAAALVEEALDLAMAEVDHDGLHHMLSHAGSTGTIRAAVIGAHDRLRAAGMAHPAIRVPAPRATDDDALQRLRDLVAAIDAHPDRNDRHGAGIDAIRAMLTGGASTPTAPCINRVARAAVKDLIVEADDLAEAIWTTLVERESHPQLEGFALLLDAFAGHYARLKAERGALDYEDLQLAALRVLTAGHPYRFARVYVDEFQDANAVQDRIIEALGAERTTVVGDGAQAIYGFRHASAEHFMTRIGEAPELTLRDNHRSQPQLMTALNALLGEVMRGQRAFAPLTPGARPDPDAPPMLDPPVELITVVSTEGDATREQEAKVVADQVRRFLDHGYRPRDIAVLFRSLTAVEPYRAALTARDVPVHLVAGAGFFTHEQVADVLALLALVENPHDEPALVRVLAGPHIGGSDTDLVDLRRAAPDGGPLWPAAATVPTLAGIVPLRDGLLPVLREQGLAALVEAAIGCAGYDLAVLGWPDGPRRYANLRRLARMAERFAAVRGPDLRGFLSAMDTLAADPRLDPGEAVLVDPDLDAVRLATIHSVKGQQFPVVILADASHGTPGQYPAVLVDQDGNAGLRAQRADGDNADVLGYAQLKDAANRAASDEERRVLYVALTRAMRHAQVIGRAERKGGGVSTMYTLAAEAAGTGLPGVAVERREVPAVEVPDRKPPPVAPPAVEVPAPVIPPAPVVDPIGGMRLSFSALATFATCPRRFHLEVERGLPQSREHIGVPGAGDGSGTAVGTLVHAALAEHAWGGSPPSAGWARARAAGLGLEVPEAGLARAERLVDAVLADPLAERIANGVEVLAEQPFAIEVDGVVQTGAIDLQVREADGTLLVIDWKTHTLVERTAEQVMDAYRLQQSVYGLAALRGGAEPVELRWVFPEALNEPQVRLVSHADTPALEREIGDRLQAIRGVERNPIVDTISVVCAACPGLDAFCPVGTAALRAPEGMPDVG
ncbi:MAG: UvrD-helicase domain-containing protein [Thermoleophilia bacterium]|nr:UvrD-helicase domain-containing protein [Thermoleophilia bacterium]